jgi:hypothetical protein
MKLRECKEKNIAVDYLRHGHSVAEIETSSNPTLISSLSASSGPSSVPSLTSNFSEAVSRYQNNDRNSINSKNKYEILSYSTGSRTGNTIERLLVEKQLEILDHNRNIIRLETLKTENNSAAEKRIKLNYEYNSVKKKLKIVRGKRNQAEKLFDKQQCINNLSGNNGVAVRARLFFIGKLNESDQKLLGVRKGINKFITEIEKEARSKNNAIIKNEVLTNAKKNEIAVLKKTIKSNAVALYSQMLRIKKENRNLSTEIPVAIDLNVKNGKYLLIPLVRAGKFQSFGAQLAYQTRRMIRRSDELPAQVTPAVIQANQRLEYERVEI